MKDLAPFTRENAALRETVLETVVSAHYLALQLRMLAGTKGFAGAAETELMADALSRWARLAAAQSCVEAGESPGSVAWTGSRGGAAKAEAAGAGKRAKSADARKSARTGKLGSARR